MPRHPPDRELIDLVLEATARGTPVAEIATLAGRGEQTIRGWIRRYGGGRMPGASVATPAMRAQYSGIASPPAAVGVDPPVDDPAPPPPLPAGASSLEMARHAHATSMHAAMVAMRIGNSTAAQRHMRDATQVLPTIARFERDAAGDVGGVHIAADEVARVRSELTNMFHKLLDRPLLCAHCGRALSVSLAESQEE